MPTGLAYIVEPMTLADVDQVMEIEQISFPSPWSRRAFRYEIAKNEHATMLVVRLAPSSRGWLSRVQDRLNLSRPGTVLGYAGFWLLVDDIHISTIAVQPQWRGRGLGELLMISVLDRGAELNARRATLEVRVSNLAAQGLYEKYGFAIATRRKRYYVDNNEDAYIMATLPFETAEFQANLGQRRSQLFARLQVEGANPHRG